MRTRLLAAAALAAVAVVQVPSAQVAAAPATADGFASVAGYGHGPTTGGAGGPTVTVSTTAAFLAAIAQAGPLTIQFTLLRPERMLRRLTPLIRSWPGNSGTRR